MIHKPKSDFHVQGKRDYHAIECQHSPKQGRSGGGLFTEDGYVAGVSHLPFVLSAALVNAVSKDPSWRDMKTLTSSGFRDVSRLAAGSATMARSTASSRSASCRAWR